MKFFNIIKLLLTVLFSKKNAYTNVKKKDKINFLSINKCNICGSKNIKLLYKYECQIYNAEYKIFECINCGHGFLGNPPKKKCLKDKYYFINDDIYYKRNFKKIKKTNIEKFKLIENFKKLNSVLEIGCMHGEFLNFLKKKSYNITGVDIIDRPKFLNKKNYKKGNFEDINFNKKFDIIISFANLEHVYDPKSYILKCKEILNNNGRLIIQSVNFSSDVSKKLFNEDVPLHLNFFNFKSLENLFEANRLKIEKKIFNTDLYHDYSEGYFARKILKFFNIDYSQKIRDECNFFIPYTNVKKLIHANFNFKKFRYKLIFILDYCLNKITRVKLNYQFIIILKKI